MKEKMVYVEWDDAAYNSGYYDKEDTTGKFKPCSTKTVGFIVKSDRKALIISHDRFYDSAGKLDDERHITIIPRGMIKRIVALHEKHK